MASELTCMMREQLGGLKHEAIKNDIRVVNRRTSRMQAI